MKTFLRKQVQSLVYRLLLLELPKPFEHVGGYCWRSQIPRSRDSRSSKLLLFEDCRYLGPAGSKQKYIESIGQGWYQHDGESIYFSTPDNTDPNSNERVYSYSTSAWLHSRNSGAANNLLRREITEAAIATDVRYAIQGEKYRQSCSQFEILDVAGKDILELGPGPSCAWALLLACHGANVTVIDPYPAAWDESYHPVFFQALREKLSASRVNVRPIDQLLEAKDFSEQVIRRSHDPVEQMEFPNDSFDVVFSNAVGEHFYDCGAAFEQLHRVTKPGGSGFHWIDYRDHRDFSTPLEYLLMSDAEFAREFGLRRGEIGNRLRADEMCEVIERAGFDVVHREATKTIDEAYLRDFEPRLRAATTSRYRDMSEAKLQVLSERVVLRKS